LQALEDPWGSGPEGVANAIAFLRQAIAEAEKQEPVRMRMPKVGDRVICLEDETLGTVKYLTAGGSPEIKFDDGSYGTYLLREFAELFCYTAPVHVSDISQERVDETAKDRHEPVAWREVAGKTTQYYDYNEQERGEPLYAAPQPDLARVGEVGVWGDKREWVGLTGEEVHDAFNFVEFVKQVSFDRDRPEWCENFAAYLEAKLKEKNT